ncbi:hypothetical protein [Aestuariivirga sp.]|jgi:hypothetical protein|uniref:hypothetical protein n=1 Tax=Aestuariivirga sp. TaxID=2650926 RepID=UPI0037831860
MQIKIFGERNSGTNALAAMIGANSASRLLPGTIPELNTETAKHVARMRRNGCSVHMIESEIDHAFKDQSINHQWKHTATNFDLYDIPADTHYVFIVRNPLSWVLSLFKSPYHILVERPQSFEAFYSMSWKTLGRDNLAYEWCKPIDLYKFKLQSYRSFIYRLLGANRSFTILHFEKLIQRQETCFFQLRPYLDNPAVIFSEFTRSTKDHTKSLSHYKQYYGSEEWRQEIEPAILDEYTFDEDLWSFFESDAPVSNQS